MRLLFDEPLSEKLITLLGDLFPGSLHVRRLGAGGARDLTSKTRFAPFWPRDWASRLVDTTLAISRT